MIYVLAGLAGAFLVYIFVRGYFDGYEECPGYFILSDIGKCRDFIRRLFMRRSCGCGQCMSCRMGREDAMMRSAMSSAGLSRKPTLTKFFEPINHRKFTTVITNVYKICKFGDGTEKREVLELYSSGSKVELVEDNTVILTRNKSVNATGKKLGEIVEYDDLIKVYEKPKQETVLEEIVTEMGYMRNPTMYEISDGKAKLVTEISVEIDESEEEFEICDYIVRGREE